MSLTRRDVLVGLSAAAAAPACSRWSMTDPTPTPDASLTPGRQPFVFVAHGAPPLLDDVAWMDQLTRWGATLGKPRAIVVVSAHWEADVPTIGAPTSIPLVYDFYGFPERFYRIQYETPDATDVAARVRSLLTDAGARPADAPDRGLDHGVYVPLLAMFPRGDVPVLQVSLPLLSASRTLALGRALLPLRDEGVLVMGSGFLTHNLRAGMLSHTPAWASDFDAWAADALRRRDVDALVDFEAKAPGVRMAHPRTEHYLPVLVTAAALAEGGEVRFPTEGWWFGGFTRRSVQVG